MGACFSETDGVARRYWQVGWPASHIFVTITDQIGILYSEQEISSAK
jgi:hypothetical protein